MLKNKLTMYQLGVCISENASLVFKSILKEIGVVILQNVDVLNKLDLEIGDGDNGSTISRFASGNYLLFKIKIHLKKKIEIVYFRIACYFK